MTAEKIFWAKIDYNEKNNILVSETELLKIIRAMKKDEGVFLNQCFLPRATAIRAIVPYGDKDDRRMLADLFGEDLRQRVRRALYDEEAGENAMYNAKKLTQGG